MTVQLGTGYLLAGRLEDALPLAQRALARPAPTGNGATRRTPCGSWGTSTPSASPPMSRQAETHYQEALVLADELGMRPLQAHCHRGLGTLYAQAGRPEQARTALSTAIALYRDMGMTFWLPQAEAVLAQVEAQ